MTDAPLPPTGRRTESAELILARSTPEMPAANGWEIAAAPSGENPEGGLDFGRYFSALRKRFWLALIVSLPVSALAAFATWKYLPKTYTTSAVLQLDSAERQLIFQTADSSSAGTNEFEMFKRTQRQLLRSRYVIVPALRDESLKTVPALQAEPDAVAWLEKKLVVNFPDNAEVMSISLTAEQPEGLHLILQSIVKSYFAQVVNVERQRKVARLNHLEVAYATFENEWRSKQTELTEFVERVGGAKQSELSLKQQNAIEEYSNIRKRIQELQLELLELELAGQKGDAPEPDKDILAQGLSLALRSDAKATQLRMEKEQKLALIKSNRQLIQRQDKLAAQLEPLQRGIEALDQKLEARTQELRRDLLDQYRRSDLILKETYRQKADLLAGFEAQAQSLEAAVGNTQSSTDVELMRIKVAGLQKVVGDLASEIERTKVELRSDSAEGGLERVRVISAALPAVNADAKTRLTKAAGAGIVALLLPMLLLIWLEARVDHIHSAGEVGRALGLSVIGHVPLIPRKVMQRLGHASKKHRQWRMRLSESVDTIAAVILREKKRRNLRLIMVSSATAGEGKTTLSANLATSLAGAGYRTCLVDFDLRRPALHRVFNLPIRPGVNDVLQDLSQFDSAIQDTGIPALSFLPAGVCNARGLSELSNHKMESLFSLFRASFDFMIIDGSPVLPVVDTRLIAQHVDTVILSVLRDVSRMQQLQKACTVLNSFSVPICGLVVTGSHGEAYPKSYYDSIATSDAG